MQCSVRLGPRATHTSSKIYLLYLIYAKNPSHRVRRFSPILLGGVAFSNTYNIPSFPWQQTLPERGQQRRGLDPSPPEHPCCTGNWTGSDGHQTPSPNHQQSATGSLETALNSISHVTWHPLTGLNTCIHHFDGETAL